MTYCPTPNDPFSHQITLDWRGNRRKVIQGAWTSWTHSGFSNGADVLHSVCRPRMPWYEPYLLHLVGFRVYIPAWVGSLDSGRWHIPQTPSFGWEVIRVLEWWWNLGYTMTSGESQAQVDWNKGHYGRRPKCLHDSQMLRKNSTTAPITWLGRLRMHGTQRHRNGPLSLPNKYLCHLYVEDSRFNHSLTAAKCASFVKAVPQAIRNRTLTTLRSLACSNALTSVLLED